MRRTGSLGHRCASETAVRLLIKMQPKSLELVLPLEWEVNKIKCLLVSKVPTLQFGKFHFRHDGEQLSGRQTLSELLQLDNDQECRRQQRYVLTFTANEQDNGQFELYYSLKVRGLLQMARRSPFQPLLHPGYAALQESHGKHKPQNVFLMPNILNLNNGVQVEVNNQGGWGMWRMLGQGGNDNVGIFERVLGLFIRGWRLLMLFYLLNFLMMRSSLNHAMVLGLIVAIYFSIAFLRKKAENGENVRQDNQNSVVNEERQQRSSIVVWMAKKACLIVQVLISFHLSLFPNWNIETHRATFRSIYLRVEQKLKQLQNMPEALSNPPIPHEQPLPERQPLLNPAMQ